MLQRTRSRLAKWGVIAGALMSVAGFAASPAAADYNEGTAAVSATAGQLAVGYETVPVACVAQKW